MVHWVRTPTPSTRKLIDELMFRDKIRGDDQSYNVTLLTTKGASTREPWGTVR